MKISDMIERLQNFQEAYGNIDAYLTSYECGEELKHKVEYLFLDITPNDQYVVIIT